MTWVRFWRGVAISIAVAETIAIRTRDPKAPASHCGRVTMHLDTTPGRVGFVLGWAGLTAWLIPHLLRQPTSRVSLTLDS